MRIGIQTWGTSGDIKPVILLARQLGKRGHNVTLAITSTEEVSYNSFENVEIKIVGEFDYSKSNLKGLWSMSDSEQLNLSLEMFFYPVLKEIQATANYLCATHDVVIGTPIQYALAFAAEKANIPFITIDFGHGYVPNEEIPAGVRVALNASFLTMINGLRKIEGLHEVNDIFSETFATRKMYLIAVSNVFCKLSEKWSSKYKVSGFFDENDQADSWMLPEDLLAFLQEGPAPLLMTIGGAVIYENTPEDIFEIFCRSIKLAGGRAIIQTKPEYVNKIPDAPGIYKLGYAPHKKIIPHCFAVVHHGSAGMANMVTLCGRPSIVIEYGFDQAFWGNELVKIGVAPKAIRRKTLTARELARAIREVLATNQFTINAEQCAGIMASENGIKTAAQLIEGLLEQDKVLLN